MREFSTLVSERVGIPPLSLETGELKETILQYYEVWCTEEKNPFYVEMCIEVVYETF